MNPDILGYLLHQLLHDFCLDREYSKGNPSNFSYIRIVLGNFMTPAHMTELSCITNILLNFHKAGVGTADMLCGREAFKPHFLGEILTGTTYFHPVKNRDNPVCRSANQAMLITFWGNVQSNDDHPKR